MAAVQEMCARIGMVTSKGLTGTLKEHYSKPILYLMLLFSFPAILMNIGANIAGMGAVGNMLFPSVNAGFFSVGFTVMLMGIFVFLPYRKFAALLKYLCVVLLVYLIVPFLYKQDFLSILKGTFIPNIAFTKEFVGILVAILGTTISPYLFFWQATMVSEDRNLKRKKIIVDKEEIEKFIYKKSFIPPKLDKVRIVITNGNKGIMCGGTHVSFLGEIGKIKIDNLLFEDNILKVEYSLE